MGCPVRRVSRGWRADSTGQSSNNCVYINELSIYSNYMVQIWGIMLRVASRGRLLLQIINEPK